MKNFILITFATLALTACGEGFKQSPANGEDNGSLGCIENCDTNNNNNTNDSGSEIINPDIELDGKVSGGVWDGKELLKLDLASQTLLVRVPVDFEAQIVQGSFPIPGKQGLTLEFVTDTDGSKHLQLRIPLADLLKIDDVINQSGLPNGDPLPMVTGGQLPHIATNIGDTEVHFYLGKGTAALFVPTKFDPFLTLVFPIKNKKKDTLGYFASIAEKPGFNGGLYASVQLPDDMLKAIDTWLPLAP
ncbi:MAG: hypothetical protein KDD58_10695 [Bdellovibrionales bacterium]|nr:hypothetical protein [Bdellovibrionales bacterium]